MWRTVTKFLKKTKREISYNPAISLVHIPREDHNLRRYMDPNFTAALFTITKTQKQPKYPSTEEPIKKKQYTCIIEYYLSIIRKSCVIAEMQIVLETVIQIEVSRRKTNTVYQCIYVKYRKIVQIETQLQRTNI